MASSSKKRSRAAVTVLLCLVAVCVVAVLTVSGLVKHKLNALQQGASFQLNYGVATQDSNAHPALYSILEQAGATTGTVDGLYSPGQLQLSLTASNGTQPFTRIYVDKDETLFDAAQLYETLRQSVISRYPLASSLLPDWTLGDYISQSQLASMLGVQDSQVSLQDMTGFTLDLSNKKRVHPDRDTQGYTYYQLSAEGADSPVLVLGFPLKSLLLDDTIPVDIQLEVPAHGVTISLNGTITPSLNTLLAPSSRIEDSDIASFIQLRQTLQQIAQIIQNTLSSLG